MATEETKCAVKEILTSMLPLLDEYQRIMETLSDEVIIKFLLYLFGLEDKIDFIEDINVIIAKIEEAVKDGILDSAAAQLLINTLRSLMKMVSDNGKLITDKEVLNKMRQVDTIEIVDVVQVKEDGKADGRIEGEAKERRKNIMSLYSHDFEPLDIAKLLNLSKEEVDKIINSEVAK